MDEVRQTSDATLDSRFLLEATDVALKKTTSLALGNGTIGIDVDDGHCALRWEILWEEVRILE